MNPRSAHHFDSYIGGNFSAVNVADRKPNGISDRLIYLNRDVILLITMSYLKPQSQVVSLYYFEPKNSYLSLMRMFKWILSG